MTAPTQVLTLHPEEAAVPEGLTEEPIAEAYRNGLPQFGYATVITKLPGADKLPVGRFTLYARPASDDAKAAQRYRWLKEKMHRTVWCGNGYEFGSIYIDDPERTDDLDATIDAAIAASKETK